MDSKLETSFLAFCSVPFQALLRKNKGFSLMEVLCALTVLALVILAAFAALNYTLKITVASRSRMEAFAAAERAAVASLALKKGVSEPQIGFVRVPVNGTLSINGANQPVRMEAFIYKEKESARLDRLMKRPAFITFLREKTP
jgi:prepilin-type N-terminal cleavage/methylation domain-containing protein